MASIPEETAKTQLRVIPMSEENVLEEGEVEVSKLKMSKKSLAKGVAELFNLSQNAAMQIVDMIFSDISDALSVGTRVDIAKFGSFVPVLRPERRGRNPKTEEEIIIPERIRVKFKCSSTLKKLVSPNEGEDLEMEPEVEDAE